MLTILKEGQPIRARDERKPDHFWADKEIVEDYLPDIGAIAFSVYMLLCYYARSSTGRAWPSIALMAKKLKLSAPTVRKSLTELQDAKLILIDENYKLSKSGKRIPQPYTYTLTAVKKKREKTGVLNDVDQGVLNVVEEGTKPPLGGVLNDVYANKTDIEQDLENKTSLPQAASTPEPIQSTEPSEPTNLKAESGEPPSVPIVSPIPEAPPKTRWIYPLQGDTAHLVRDANQPTVTFCGIRPLPSYGGIPVPAHPQQPCPACLAKASDNTQEHMRPIEAWCKTLGDIVPPTFDMGTFARVSKQWHHKGITADEMRCAAEVFGAWVRAQTAPPVIRWEVGAMLPAIEASLSLCRMGIVPADMVAYVKELKKKDFWATQSVSFDYVCKNVTTWKVAQSPGHSKPNPNDMSERIPDPDNPSVLITRGQLQTRLRDKALIEKEYGRAG